MEQATHMSLDNIRCFAAGLTALIQVTVLPGWLVVSRFGTGALLIDVLAALVVSLVTTFNIAFLLQLTGVYDRIALSVIVIGEILLLTIFNRRNAGVVTQSPVPLRLWPRNGFLVANIIALVIMLWFVMRMLMVLWSHVPGVFEEWDAVVSWSRWAVDWYEGRWPVETYGYPQLVPAMWSITYLWLGSDQIEIFSRAMMGLFPIAILAIFFDFFLRRRRPAPLMAAVLLAIVLLGPYAPVLDSGYVDTPVTFLILFTGYLTYLSAQEGMPGERLLIFAGITAAAAVLCKQGGWLGVGILITGIYSSLAGHLQITPPRRRRAALLTITIFAALVLPWFALKWFNPEETNVRYVTSLIHGNETHLQRLLRALTVTLPDTLLPSGSLLGKGTGVLSVSFISLMFISLWSKLGRMCLAVGIPYLLVWALFFSYDGRNLLPALPFLCLAIGFGLEQIMVWGIGSRQDAQVNIDPNRQGDTRAKCIRYGLNIVIILVVLFALWPVNPSGLKLWSDDLRLRSGDSGLNRQLLEFARQPGFHGQVFTTYPQMFSIPALRPHVFTSPDGWRLPRNNDTVMAIKTGCPFCEILSTIPGSETITYALIHNTVIPSLIDAAIADGSLHPVITTPTIRLLRVCCTH